MLADKNMTTPLVLREGARSSSSSSSGSGGVPAQVHVQGISEYRYAFAPHPDLLT